MTSEETVFAQELIERIVRQCGPRRATSAGERSAQRLVQSELQLQGASSRLEEFSINESLYANLALHFGLGTAGSLVSSVAPLFGLALHLTAGTSFMLDSTKRRYLLRRLLPFKRSQNLVITLPAQGSEPRLRLVFMAHIDAAFTGLMFDPRLASLLSPEKVPPQLRFAARPLAQATYGQFLLAGIDLLRIGLGPLTWPLIPLEVLLTLPSLGAFLLNLEVVLRDEIVPGANDDLSGVAGLVILARRLAPLKPDDLELVFVFTGAEEAGAGGAFALASDRTGSWDPERTVVLGLDGLSNGELRYFEEAELVRTPLAPWLEELITEVAGTDPAFAGVCRFSIPVGLTDVLPFLTRGYSGVTFGCLDPELGTPKHYHLPSDTPEHLDPDQIVECVDFVEQVVREIVRRRLGVALADR